MKSDPTSISSKHSIEVGVSVWIPKVKQKEQGGFVQRATCVAKVNLNIFMSVEAMV